MFFVIRIMIHTCIVLKASIMQSKHSYILIIKKKNYFNIIFFKELNTNFKKPALTFYMNKKMSMIKQSFM